MKTIKTLAIVVSALVSFSTFATIKTDKEPVVIKAWGLVFGSLESISKLTETPGAPLALPKFKFSTPEDMNAHEIEALKALDTYALPAFEFGTPEDINLKDADALKSVNPSNLPEFRLNSVDDINVNEIEALKEVKNHLSLPLFFAGTPQDVNVQEIEALKGIIISN